MNRLLIVAEQVLRLTPVWLWWAVGGLLFGGVNLAFYQEVWPNSPAAGSFFKVLILASLAAIPLAVIQTIRSFARTLQSSFWRLLWQLILVVSFLGACVMLLALLVAAVLLW